MAKHYKNQNQNKIIPIKSAREKGKRYKTSQKSGSRFTASVFSRGWKAVRGAVTSAGAAVASVFVKCGEFIGSGLRRQNGRSARSTRGSRYQPRFGQAQKPVRTEPPASTEKTAPVRLKHGRAAREESGRDSVPAAVVPKEKKHEKPVRLDKSGKRKKLKKVNPLTLPENLPSSAQLENELNHARNKRDNNRLVRNTVFALITVAAAAVLVATLFLPILQIYGTSMTPTLSEGEIVVSVKGSAFERGDVISFYYNNKILVKRIIAFEGEYVNIDDEGKVFLNNKVIEEPYLTEQAFGECDLKLPYQVPAGKIFVLGDHRKTSVDSRSSVMGCVSEEQIVGKIVFRVWPLDRLGEIG